MSQIVKPILIHMQTMMESQRAQTIMLSLWCAIPILWLCGVYVTDVSVILCGLMIPCLIFLSRNLASQKNIHLARFYPWLLLTLITYPLLVGLVLTAKIYRGQHGIDHSIFTQVIDSVATRGGYFTSLNRVGWRNFLDDHWTPILGLPALIEKIGPDHMNALDIYQALSIIGFILGSFLFIRSTGFDPYWSTALTFTLVFLRPVRHQFFWGPQVEFLSLPFVAFSYYFWIKRKMRSLVASLILATLCKETLFLFSSMFALMVAATPPIGVKRNSRKESWGFFALGVIFLFGFLSFTYGHAWFFDKPYDYLERAQPLQALLNPERLGLKVWQLISFFLPVLALPLWRPQAWRYLMPAWPFFGMCAVSSFEPMFSTGSHYNVMPSVLVFYAAVLTAAHFYPKLTNAVPTWALLWCVLISFAWQSNTPTKILLEWWRRGNLNAAIFEAIAPNAKVIVSDAAVPFLLSRQELMHIDRLPDVGPRDMNYVAIKHDEKDRLGKNAVAFTLCREDDDWSIYCRN